MTSIHNAVLDLKRLDLLAYDDSSIHRLDARAKVLVTTIFIIAVISFGKYDLSSLLPFFIFPAAMIARSGLPPLFILRKILLLCPFVVMVGIFNPLLDRQAMLQLGPLAISGGWISFVSILIKSVLTVGAAFILVGVTGFTAVCQALEQMGMPQTFAVQLLFLYRYIFVLAEEGSRASRARELRSCGKKGLGIHSFSSLVGHLLLRTWQRAERVHMAMLARGFTGRFHTQNRSSFGTPEIIFVSCWIVLFILFRLQNIPALLGSLIMRSIQ